MNQSHPRLVRESKTIEAMIHLYCRHQHGKPGPDHLSGICPECRELVEYANGRLSRCPFQENKPTCAKCAVHCYKPDMRQRIREVMRYAGPRLLYHRPFLAILHLTLDNLRKPSDLKHKSSPAELVNIEVKDDPGA